MIRDETSLQLGQMPIPKDISIRHTPAKAGKRSQNENYMEHMDEGSHRRESKGLPTQRGRQRPGWGRTQYKGQARVWGEPGSSQKRLAGEGEAVRIANRLKFIQRSYCPPAEIFGLK